VLSGLVISLEMGRALKVLLTMKKVVMLTKMLTYQGDNIDIFVNTITMILSMKSIKRDRNSTF
jgi:hypothetical protein